MLAESADAGTSAERLKLGGGQRKMQEKRRGDLKL